MKIKAAPLLLSALLLFGCGPSVNFDKQINENSNRLYDEGRNSFRYDTFGSEDFWGGLLKLQDAVKGERLGGVGTGLSPADILGLGLKIDKDKVSWGVARSLTGPDSGPKETIALLKADAIVGVKGFFDEAGSLKSVGIQCSLCHSIVDDSASKGVGSRLDGWPNRDLNMGGIIALAPELDVIAERLSIDTGTLKRVLEAWGPGRFDSEVLHDGQGFRPDGKTAATLVPATYGLAGVNSSYTGLGPDSYINAYSAITQMRGKGIFFDPRLNDPDHYPIAARTGDWNIRNSPDLVTSKLAALHFYELALPAPRPPEGSFNSQSAARGREVFEGKARCASCHVPPLYSEPGWAMHTADEIGIDDFQASRSPERQYYRTTPLKGLFARTKGGFYHDGRFPDLAAVIDHYNDLLGLSLTDEEKADLKEHLKSL
ncbi:MAG: hypothetical protein HY893_01170 [Deltaproteobacteria bacterium]|nr:hypothetical protein [Deltaproteobacteria bacterium]